MYIATQDFKPYRQGPKKKGDQVEFNPVFLEAGLIEEVDETKPHQSKDIETKPEPKKAKQTK